ncbi:MAG: M48 family metallopeptidase [Victivallaceae bacterium]
MKVFLILTAAAAMLAIAGCTTVEGTGRKQLMLSSESEENAEGAKAWKQLLKTEKRSADAKKNEMLQRVGTRLAKAANKPAFHWEFVVFQSKTPNAFALPGGYVAVYDSLFEYAANDAELAAVVGHEIGHVLARHGGERMSQSAASDFLGSLAAVASEAVWAGSGTAASGTYSAASQLGVLLPYSRAQELEADYLGLMLMAKAGYDPAAAIKFWEKFGKLGSNSRLEEFFSTHPISADRIAELKKHLPEAEAIYQKSK